MTKVSRSLFMPKQIVWIVLGTVAFLVTWLDYHRIARLAYPAYAIILILLAVVLFEGKSSRGAQRWTPMGPFAFTIGIRKAGSSF